MCSEAVPGPILPRTAGAPAEVLLEAQRLQDGLWASVSRSRQTNLPLFPASQAPASRQDGKPELAVHGVPDPDFRYDERRACRVCITESIAVWPTILAAAEALRGSRPAPDDRPLSG